MKTAGPESPFFKKVENPNPDPRPAPTAHFPPIILEFSDTAKMVDFATNRTTIWQPEKEGSITHYVCTNSEILSEIGTRTWDDALVLARRGWPEGRKLLTAARAQFLSFGKIPTKTISYDVAGAFPDIPRFLAGDPEHMLDFGASLKKSKPIIRLIISASCQISVTAEARANWGAALLSWVAAEELAGNVVEIDLIYVTMAPSFYWDEYKWGPPIIVKCGIQKTNLYKSLDQLAFWLMHTAAHRRIQFAVREKINIGKWYKMYQVYGNVVNNREELQKFCDRNSILLILGNGAKSVSLGLTSIEEEVNKWKERQIRDGFAAQC